MINTDFASQIWGGASIYRVLMNSNMKFATQELTGKTLDLAGGTNPTYKKYLPCNIEYVSVDIKNGVDFNKPLPFNDGEFDNVLFINAIYIVKNRPALYSEIMRILKPGGSFVLVSPFISNEMPEPNDFCRLTLQGIEAEFYAAGFKKIITERFGDRFSSSTYLLEPIWRFRIIRFVIYSLAIFFDNLIPLRIKLKHPSPLGYLSRAIK